MDVPPELQDQVENINEDRTSYFIASVSVVVGIATASTALRLYARKLKKLPLAADDYTIILALFCTWAFYILNIFQALNGLGRHFVALTPEQITNFSKFLYSTDLVYPTCLLLIQSSFLFFYVRVFTLQNRKFRYAVFTLAGLSVAIFIATFFVAVFKCHPIAFNWNREIPGGSCINTKAFFISALALNTFNDVLIVLLPVPMIWRVQIPKSEKIALLAVFLFGGFVCVGNLIRLPYLIRADPMDLTYTLVDAMIWYIAEQCIGIICACLPCYRPYLLFFKHSIGYVASFATGSSFASRHKSTGVELGNSYGSSRKNGGEGKSDVLTDTVQLKNESGSIDGSSQSAGAIEVRHDVCIASDKADPEP